MDVAKAKRETMSMLGLTETEVAYITEELLAEYANAKEVDKSPSNMDDDVKKFMASKNLLVGFGTYGNSLVFLSGRVDYKAGPRGTPNYGCGTDAWTWRSDPGDTFNTTGRTCSGGRAEYLLYCPTCI